MTRPPRLVGTVVLAIVVSAATFGCGGGDDDGPAAPTGDTFIGRADRICARGQVDLQERVTATFGNQAPTEEEGVTFTTNETIPLLQAQIEELRALTPPEGDQETLEGIWDAMDDGVETLEQDPESAVAGGDPMADALELARSYGFRSCGSQTPVAPA